MQTILVLNHLRFTSIRVYEDKRSIEMSENAIDGNYIWLEEFMYGEPEYLKIREIYGLVISYSSFVLYNLMNILLNHS